jgi:hypothetical protein
MWCFGWNRSRKGNNEAPNWLAVSDCGFVAVCACGHGARLETSAASHGAWGGGGQILGISNPVGSSFPEEYAYEIHAEKDGAKSATRTISSFDNKKEIVVPLKIEKKKT